MQFNPWLRAKKKDSRQFSEWLAVEFGPRQIRINCVSSCVYLESLPNLPVVEFLPAGNLTPFSLLANSLSARSGIYYKKVIAAVYKPSADPECSLEHAGFSECPCGGENTLIKKYFQ